MHEALYGTARLALGPRAGSMAANTQHMCAWPRPKGRKHDSQHATHVCTHLYFTLRAEFLHRFNDIITRHPGAERVRPLPILRDHKPQVGHLVACMGVFHSIIRSARHGLIEATGRRCLARGHCASGVSACNRTHCSTAPRRLALARKIHNP